MYLIWMLASHNYCKINPAGIQLYHDLGENYYYINKDNFIYKSTATVSTLKVQNNIDMNQSVSAGLGTEEGALINIHWNFRNGRNSSNPGICLRLDSKDTATTFQWIYQPANGNEFIRAQMNSSGTLTQSLSDEREKKNIIPLDPLKSLNKIMNIRLINLIG